jgi:DNA-3-methyladenine glycosylase
VRDDDTGRRVGRIVEVEAYIGRDDLASHARFGETARNRVMFGPAGHAYVYLVYGMYDCLNVTTEAAGEPAALLVRAVEPLEGIEAMRVERVVRATMRRKRPAIAGSRAEADRIASVPRLRLASGPGLVGAAFGIGVDWTGVDLCDPGSPLRLEAPPSDEAPSVVVTTPRIGIGFAGEPWITRPWRFIERGHPSVSGPASAR